MEKRLKKRIEMDPVTTAGAALREEYELDKDTHRVSGILVTSNRDEMLFHRGRISVMIGGVEIIPEDYHVKLLMSGLSVPPQNRYLPLDAAPGNFKVKVTFRDTDSPTQSFDQYIPSIYLETTVRDED